MEATAANSPDRIVVAEVAKGADTVAVDMAVAEVVVGTTTRTATTATSRTTTMARSRVEEATAAAEVADMVVETRVATEATVVAAREGTVAEAKEVDADVAATTMLADAVATAVNHTTKAEATEATGKGHTVTIAAGTTQVEDANGRLLLHLHVSISIVYTFLVYVTL